MGHAFVRCDVDMIDPKFISGKIVQNAPSLNKDLVSGSLLCSRRDELCSIRVQQNRGVETCTTGNLNTPVGDVFFCTFFSEHTEKLELFYEFQKIPTKISKYRQNN